MVGRARRYNILVRNGRQVQEVHVVTSLSREEIKKVLVSVTGQLADLDDGVPAFDDSEQL
jgi:hypothetical protein